MRRLTGKHSIPIVILACALVLSVLPGRAVETLSPQLSDNEFWQLVSTFSEPNGFFHSDNFVSNERSFQHVLAELAAGREPGSAYVGVGPEQNFTYLLAVKPKIAFIVDIRRQNLIEHLMYKALFELSADRAEFLSRLLSRSRPSGLNSKSTVEDLFSAYGSAATDPQVFLDNLRSVKKRLMQDRGFLLSAEDEMSLERVARAFIIGGANLTYDGPVDARGARTVTGIMPTFEELMMETDGEGRHRSFLASEENFRTIQELQKKNLIVPIVGNFAGSRALRSVGQYLRNHGATVTAFYTSNVEQYLFMDRSWKDFYENVAALPIDGRSVFVRGLIRDASGDYSSSPALPLTSRYETKLFPIGPLVDALNGGAIQRYGDILAAR
jgi:hypothetical protein